MKKLVPIIILVLFIGKLLAQPVIADASNFPLPGVVFSVDHVQDTSGMSVTGANSIWSFDKVVVNNLSTLTIQDPSSTPFYSSYPTSDFAFVQIYASTLYDYLLNSPNKLECVGNAIDLGTGVGQDFTPDPQTWFKFPFNFGDTISDSYYEVGANAESLFLTYDGYGTLYLPTITYSNVVRIRMDYWFGTELMWWSTNPLFPVMYFKRNLPTLYAFTPQPATSVDNVKAESSIFIYPNPGNGKFTIERTKNKVQSIKIYDVLGEEINGNPLIENGQWTFELKDSAKGIYFISIFDEEKNIVKKKIILQ